MTFPGLVKANNLSDVADKEKAWDNLGANVATGDININISAPLLLNLDFAANKSLVDNVSGNNLITFSRASTGTFVGSNGLIQTAASGVPRFSHDSSGASLGLLVEEAKTNFRLNSTISLSTWSSFNNNATLVASNAIAPDGTASAISISNNTGIDNQYCWGNFQSYATIPTTGYLCASVFVKMISGTEIGVKGGVDNQGWYGFAGIIINFATSIPTITFTGAPAQNAIAGGVIQYSNGWWRAWFVVNTANGFNSGVTKGPGVVTQSAGTSAYVWGAQIEAGTSLTSYIPTIANSVPRAADVASITGTNFSSWSNNYPGGTYFASFLGAGCAAFSLNGAGGITDRLIFVSDSSSRIRAQLVTGGVIVYDQTPTATFSTTLTNKYAFAFGAGSQASALNGTSGGAGSATNLFNPTSMQIGQETAFNNYLNGTISSITYRSSILSNVALGAITQLSSGSSSVYSFNYVIKGKDVLNLNGVNSLLTSDFVYARNLLSAAQPRLTVAAQSTASGVALAGSKLLKLSPSSVGNYFVSNGSLSAQSLKINNIAAASLSTVPFSGNNALVPLNITTMEMSSNFRMVPLFSAGIVNSPSIGMPMETSEFILYGKAGQN